MKKEDILLDKDDMEKINSFARGYIEDGLFDDALTLLEFNRENNPCVMTLNNSAYFYFKFGVKNRDGRRYPQPRKALDILKNTDAYGVKRPEPYSLLGQIFFDMGDYEAARGSFEKAYRTKPEKDELLNYAFLTYLTGDKRIAWEMFCDAYLGDKSDIYARYCALFCKAELFENGVSADEIFSLAKEAENYDISEIDDIDIIYLLFATNDFENAVKLYDEIFDTYVIEPSDFHIIAYSLHKLNRGAEIGKYYEKILESYNCDYDEPQRGRIDALRRIYEGELYLKRPEASLQIKLRQNYGFLSE